MVHLALTVVNCRWFADTWRTIRQRPEQGPSATTDERQKPTSPHRAGGANVRLLC
jgi:hypothetical protein